MSRNFLRINTRGPGNPATKGAHRPADYPIGSLESRAAARAMLEAQPQMIVSIKHVATGEVQEIVRIDLQQQM